MIYNVVCCVVQSCMSRESTMSYLENVLQGGDSGIGCLKSKQSLAKTLLIFGLIIVVLVLIILLCLKPPSDTPAQGYQGTRSPSTSIAQLLSTRRPGETFPGLRPMEYLNFKVHDSDIISSDRVAPHVLDFKHSGRYNITVSVTYDEDYCRRPSPDRGRIHLALERARDLSKVGKGFTQSFVKDPRRSWVVHGFINELIHLDKGQQLVVQTDHIDCIQHDRTKLHIANLSL